MSEAEGIGIGAAARQLGTTERALRYYEDRGLLPPAAREPGGHRRYDSAAIDHARRIVALRHLGLDLDSIAGLLAGDVTHMPSVLTKHAAQLSQEIDDLIGLRDRIHAASLGDDADLSAAVTINLLEEISMRIVLSRIYTRTGDTGTTAIGGGVRVDKTDIRLEVLGDIDELVSALGMAVAAGLGPHAELVRAIQNDLFDLGADVASTHGASQNRIVTGTYVERIEAACDRINGTLDPPDSFVLPGSGTASAAVHHARAICRRAERHAWSLSGLSDEARRYLNRLSDLLFILARATETEPEPTWQPAVNRRA